MIATTDRLGFSLSAWLGRHVRLSYAVVFLGLQAIAQFPIWHSNIPALSDYPNHLARMHILLNAGHSAVLNQFYEIHWSVLPNMAMDMVVPLLAGLVGLDFAAKLFLSLVLFLISGGTLALHYVLHGRMSIWPFMIFLFLYNPIFLGGVVNYLFGIGIALWVIAAWIATCTASAVWRLPVFSLVVLFLFFCHLSTYGFYAAVLIAYEVGQARPGGKGGFKWQGMVAAAVTLIFPVILFFLLSPTGTGEGQQFNWFGLSLIRYIAAMLIAKLIAPVLLVSSYRLWLDCVTAAVVIFVFIRGVFSKCLIINKSMVLPLVTLGGLYLLTPPVLFGSQMADSRLAVALLFTFIASTNLQLSALSMRQKAMMACVLAVLLVVRMAVIVDNWAKSDQLAASYANAFNQLPVGKRLFAVFPKSSPYEQYDAFEYNLPCLAIISRSAFVPSLYSMQGGQPVRLTPVYQGLKNRVASQVHISEQSLNLPLVLKNFDYLLVADKSKFSSPLVASLPIVASGPDFRLYRVE